MRTGLLLVLVFAALALAAPGCGGNDPSDESEPSAQRCETQPATPTRSDAAAARGAAVAYFLSCDPAACTENATKNHIRVDYDGDLAQCETVRRNNQLTPEDVRTVPARVTGREATVQGQVLVTGETFTVELELIDGSWKIDRIRGSQ